ncbi:MAG: major capsid protein [Parabacteroides sp.]
MKFEQSTYNKIWDSTEGSQIVTQILNNPDLINANHMFWAEKFRVDPQITPTNAEGEALFISRMRQMESGVLMDMRAPLGDSVPEDKKGIAYYSGIITEFISTGFVEKATERDYKEKLFEQFGDASLVAQYATDVLQTRLDSANQTLSHMAAQLLSTGKIIYKAGVGIQGNVLKAEIPAANFLKAGAKVWTDTTARLLDQIVKIVDDVNDATGLDIQWQLEVTKDQFKNCFLKNEQVIEWVRYMNIINNQPLPERLVITRDMAMPALAAFEGLPPIVIVEEKQKDADSTIVHGWKDGVAVLRPAGIAGYMRRTTIKDTELLTKYGNSVNSYSFTPALNGLATVRNSVIVNGNFKEWHTDVVLAGVPSLDQFLYHYIIDTTTANS